MPEKFVLGQNYPNPFNPKTNIEYRISNAEHVTLSIYNLLGQIVAVLVDKKQTAGSYIVQWDAAAFVSGVYYYRLSTGQGTKYRKMILIK